MNLEIIDKSEFNDFIKIRINNVIEGFEKYKYIELSPNENNNENEEAFIRTIEYFYDINEGNLIIDFYKKKLNKESIAYIKENLDKEDVKYFNELIKISEEDKYYYKVNNKLFITMLTKLCVREIYFVTFYFYKNPITVWGNYNMTFPIFYNEDTKLNIYVNIAKLNKLYNKNCI